MTFEESRGNYCLKCGKFSLRATGSRCAGCGSSVNLMERRGIICPVCHQPTPTDDPNYRRCLECDAPLPEIA